jgi:hypothetical protein
MAQRTDEEIIEAIRHCRGMLSAAARALGVTRKTIYNRRDKSEAIREAIEETRDFSLDHAELKLLSAVDNGEAWAICFFLKTQGKKRGYVERQEHDVREVPDLTVVLTSSGDAGEAEAS